jgi:regulator of protease activity HflC (stomatin/prohibitin superfamily)
MTNPEVPPVKERLRGALPGGLMLIVLFLVALGFVAGVGTAARTDCPWLGVPCLLGLAATLVCLAGLIVVNPNEAKVLLFFGRYVGTVKVQSESAVRNLATHYPYDSHDENVPSLRGHTQVVADKLRQEIHDRLDTAGVQVLEARISHLAYAPEIAEAMLRRQQAGAVIAARRLIVEGAVGMVEMALERLDAKKLVELGPEQKAAMVSNLLVVLCSEHAVAPVVNAGTLYQ